MENFLTWSVSLEKEKQMISFFATSLQFKRINQGSEEMIAKMLSDLGASEVFFEQWSIARFVTDYLVDRPYSDNWRDIWTETCEIKIQLSKPINLSVKDTDLIRTLAWDETWKGEPLELPVKCVVVADFYSPESIAIAKQILTSIEQFGENVPLIDELRAQVPYVSERIVTQFLKEYREQKRLQGKTACKLSTRQRAGLPQQLVISLGVFDEPFYAKEGNLGEWLSDLIHELGGTTTWDEKTDIEVENYRRSQGWVNQ
jgi:hypothetical protein